MLAEDSNPHAYVFSSCSEKIRAIIVHPTTTETKGNEIDLPRYTTKVHNLLGKVSLPEFTIADVEELNCQGLTPYREKNECQGL